jgi:hypothetical protein
MNPCASHNGVGDPPLWHSDRVTAVFGVDFRVDCGERTSLLKTVKLPVRFRGER